MHSALVVVISLSSEHLMEALNDKLRFLPHVGDVGGRKGVEGREAASSASNAGHLGAFRFKFAQQEISIFCFDWRIYEGKDDE